MRVRFISLIAVLAAVAVVLGAGAVSGSTGGIFGTDHDVGSPGNPSCAQCHTPHDASGNYLWARTPKTGMTGLMALCFSCHDGSVASSGQYIPTAENHKVTSGTPGADCDRCHDPHEDNWKFAKDALAPDFANANLCASSSCHPTRIGGDDHDVDVLAGSYQPIDRVWDPNLTTPDFSGTRLFNAAGDAVVASGDAYLKCGTCHVPHGGVTGSDLNSMAPTSTDSHSPICENCHQ